MQFIKNIRERKKKKYQWSQQTTMMSTSSLFVLKHVHTGKSAHIHCPELFS